MGLAILSSCSKDKKRAMELEGTWLEVKVDQTVIPDAYADKIIFGPCKNKENKDCDCTIQDGGSTYSTDFRYEIDGKGETLILKYSVGFLTSNSSSTITAYSGDAMTIQWSNYTGEYKRE